MEETSPKKYGPPKEFPANSAPISMTHEMKAWLSVQPVGQAATVRDALELVQKLMPEQWKFVKAMTLAEVREMVDGAILTHLEYGEPEKVTA